MEAGVAGCVASLRPGPASARQVLRGLMVISRDLEEKAKADADVAASLAVIVSARQLVQRAYLREDAGRAGEVKSAAPRRRCCLSSLEETLICKHIDANLSEKLSLDRLSAIVRRGERGFVRAFRATFQCTPKEYVTLRRVENAKMLLRETDIPLSELALDCGYADQAHLTRTFHAMTGETPARWRRVSRVVASLGDN